MRFCVVIAIQIILCLNLSTGAACAVSYNADSLLHKNFAQQAPMLNDLYRRIINDEDSVTWFKRANDLEQFAKQNHDHSLELEAGVMRVQFNVVRNTLNDSLCRSGLNGLLTTAVAEKDTVLHARIENLYALYNWLRGYYEQAFEHYLAAYSVMQQLSDEQYPDKFPAYGQIGNCYYYFHDYPEAIFFLKKTLDIKATLTPPEYWFTSAENTLGLCYRNLNQFDSSNYYFKRSYQSAVAARDTNWQAIAAGNLGHNFFLLKQYDHAIPLIQADMDCAIKRGDWGSAAGAQIILANISLLKKDIKTASLQAHTALQWAYQSGESGPFDLIYPVISKLYGAQGKPAMASLYLDSALEVRDSLAQRYNALQLLRARQKTDLNHHRAELAQIETQKQIKTLQRNALMAVVVILMLLSLYIYNLQRQRHIQKQQLLDLQLKEKEKQLDGARLQLSEFARNVSEKSLMLAELQQQITETDHSTLLSQLQQKTILTDAEWDHFRNLFEQVHVGFIQRLKQKIQGLTPAEVRFMVLAKLQFNTKEMAAVLGVSPQAIRTTWYRLRKKLNLPEEGSIEELVTGI